MSGALMVNAVRLVVQGEQLEGGYVITLHQEMEDCHVAGVKCKMLDVILRRAVSCDKHLNHTRCSKCRNFLVTLENLYINSACVIC